MIQRKPQAKSCRGKCCGITSPLFVAVSVRVNDLWGIECPCYALDQETKDHPILKEVFGCGGCGMRNGGVHLPVFQATAIDLEWNKSIPQMRASIYWRPVGSEASTKVKICLELFRERKVACRMEMPTNVSSSCPQFRIRNKSSG